MWEARERAKEGPAAEVGRQKKRLPQANLLVFLHHHRGTETSVCPNIPVTHFNLPRMKPSTHKYPLAFINSNAAANRIIQSASALSFL